MIHRTVERDPDEFLPTRPRRSAEQHRVALAEVQRIARKIQSGDYDPRPVSPRQLRTYGHHVPQHVALRQKVNYARTFTLGQRLKMAIYRGAEHETFCDNRLRFRTENHAGKIRRRRIAHTRRTI